jgi:hypothetical protein
MLMWPLGMYMVFPVSILLLYIVMLYGTPCICVWGGRSAVV